MQLSQSHEEAGDDAAQMPNIWAALRYTVDDVDRDHIHGPKPQPPQPHPDLCLRQDVLDPGHNGALEVGYLTHTEDCRAQVCRHDCEATSRRAQCVD